MGITDADRNFAVIPLSHSYGFSNLVTPLLARGVPMVLSSDPMPRAILRRSGSKLEQPFSPACQFFTRRFVKWKKSRPLIACDFAFLRARRCRLMSLADFARNFRRPIHSFYGSSECGGICYDREGDTVEDGFVGTAMNGVTIDILEPAAESSQVRVRSAAVGDGYFPEPDEEKLGHGFFIPDDLLRKTERGFRIVGRISDVINVAGKKVNPAEVEAELLRCTGVKQAVVFGRESSLRNQEVVACVVAAQA